MEIAILVMAVGLAGFLLLRVATGDPKEPTASAERALVVPGRVPVRVYSMHDVAPRDGTQYALALSRSPGGYWTSVLRSGDVSEEGGELTVTLVMPWGELAHRYSGVNLVVR